MFTNLFDIFKGKDFINSVHEDFSKMLELSGKMFKEAQWYIFVEETRPDMQEEIYLMDKEINKLERKIRTRVLEHLSLQPGSDMSASLIMMSVIKDAERLGDYIKNVSETRSILCSAVDQATYKELLGDLDEQISEMFVSTKKAFLDSDEELAAKVGDSKKKLASQCEFIVQKIANSKMNAKEAVTYALIARYYKRLVSHLGNIATTVILPFSDIGYYENKENLLKRNIIIGLCTANRCRSQMFEAILKYFAGDRYKVISAGTKVTTLHPLVERVLNEIDIKVVGQLSKKIESISAEKDRLVLLDEKGKKTEHHLSEVHSVITLCGGASESCPMFPGKVHREHWPIDDPDQYKGTDEEVLPYFRIARDDIYNRIQDFLARV